MSGSSLSSMNVTKYQKARAKLCEIYHRNLGYDVSNYSNASVVDVRIMMGKQSPESQSLDMVFDHTYTVVPAVDNADGAAVTTELVPAASRVYVHFAQGKSAAKNMRSIVQTEFLDRGFTAADTLVYVLLPEKPGKGGTSGSKTVRGALDEIWYREGINVVVHDLEHLQYNALDMEGQPTDIHVMGAEERAKFLADTRIDPKDLPTMSRQDTVAALLCARVGDIIYFNRPSPTAIVSPFYRIVTTDVMGSKSAKSGGSGNGAAAKKGGEMTA